MWADGFVRHGFVDEGSGRGQEWNSWKKKFTINKRLRRKSMNEVMKRMDNKRIVKLPTRKYLALSVPAALC